MPAPQRIAVITFNDIPPRNPTFKYLVLGQLALENRRSWCGRHGYDLIETVPIARDRPACWAKIPAILAAFETHDWVLWADSDTLVAEPDARIEPFLDPGRDMVVQSHERFDRHVGLSPEEGRRRMPINTGVFLMRATDWARDFLRRTYEQTQFVTRGPVWDGIGEQEAMIALLRGAPADLERIGYVERLQMAPRFYQRGDTFVHFYGNHARHLIAPDECTAVLNRWTQAVREGGALPRGLARFHWCCIQNKEPGELARGGLAAFFYRPEDIAPGVDE